MIKSTIVKLNKPKNFDNLYIEQQLKAMDLDVVRWAIVDVDDDFLTVTVSYVDKI